MYIYLYVLQKHVCSASKSSRISLKKLLDEKKNCYISCSYDVVNLFLF